MLIFYILLDGIKKFLHGVVEDAEISPTSDNIFFNDLNFVIELRATFMKIVEEMLVLIVSLIIFFSG